MELFGNFYYFILINYLLVIIIARFYPRSLLLFPILNKSIKIILEFPLATINAFPNLKFINFCKNSKFIIILIINKIA